MKENLCTCNNGLIWLWFASESNFYVVDFFCKGDALQILNVFNYLMLRKKINKLEDERSKIAKSENDFFMGPKKIAKKPKIRGNF